MSPVVEDPPLRSHPTQRMLDWLVALPLAVAAIPVVVVAALAVKLTSRGPVFYTQQRCGRGARPFRIFKLRTMHHNCEAETGACWSVHGDPRVTPVGRWLRKLHIDELPQLANVLLGQMSMVGPRPERPEILSDLEATIPNVRVRLLVRPGVTGLAQIQQPPDITPDCFRRKLLYDRHYIRHRSMWTDLKILAGTVFYLAGFPYIRVRRLAGLNVPVMPDEVILYRPSQTPARDAAATPRLDSPPGVPG